MQAIIELVSLPEEFEIVRSGLRGRVVALSKDAQGTHVVQKAIAILADEFLFDEIFASFIELCMQANGLCVIKRMI